MNRTLMLLGSFFGLTAVIIGAFATHGLEPLLTTKQLSSFETGVKYQIYHAFLLLFLSLSQKILPRQKRILLYMICLGIVLFSGSIYGLATNQYSSFDFTTIALITPVGGSLLIISWMMLFVYSFKHKEE
ncbi:DUF423 domain-containing protein [Gangjinia marincola]|uniref:DUF423 domain-containing protein n=1 Tax=Gangjinia marincola TaxID=578463 RepID=A0ABN1MH39_9FLAO